MDCIRESSFLWTARKVILSLDCTKGSSLWWRPSTGRQRTYSKDLLFVCSINVDAVHFKSLHQWAHRYSACINGFFSWDAPTHHNYFFCGVLLPLDANASPDFPFSPCFTMEHTSPIRNHSFVAKAPNILTFRPNNFCSVSHHFICWSFQIIIKYKINVLGHPAMIFERFKFI